MAARLAPASSASSVAEASAPWSSSTWIVLARSTREVKVAGSGSRVTPVTVGCHRHRLQQEVGGFRRAVEGDRARPWTLGGGDVAGMRRLGAAQQRQVQEQHERLADDDGRAAGRRAQGRRGAGVYLGIDAARLDVAGAVLADLGDAQQARAAVGCERDDEGVEVLDAAAAALGRVEQHVGLGAVGVAQHADADAVDDQVAAAEIAEGHRVAVGRHARHVLELGNGIRGAP